MESTKIYVISDWEIICRQFFKTKAVRSVILLLIMFMGDKSAYLIGS